MKKILSLGLISACLATGSTFCMNADKKEEPRNSVSLKIIDSREASYRSFSMHITQTQENALKQSLSHITGTDRYPSEHEIVVDLARVAKGEKQVILKFAGATFLFDKHKFADQLHALQAMPVDGIEIVGQTLTLEEKEQTRQALLSHIAILSFISTQGTNLIIRRDWMTSLPEAPKPELITPKVTNPTLWQKIANPTTLTFGAGCAVATWLAIKNLNNTTE